MYNNYRRPMHNQDRLAGGFFGPFLLGGITGGLVAPLFYGGYNNRPCYNCYPYYGPYYGPYYR